MKDHSIDFRIAIYTVELLPAVLQSLQQRIISRKIISPASYHVMEMVRISLGEKEKQRQ